MAHKKYFYPDWSFSLEDNLPLLRSLQELIKKPSITPHDAGCQIWLRQRLEALGFECQSFQMNGVSNLIASIGNGKRTLGFSGHTDVVPEGEQSRWIFPPFSGHLHAGYIYGRGAADMKSGIACMLDAVARYQANGGQFNTGKLYWLITSDEEGEAEYGTRAIMDFLNQQNIQLNACIVGEPTATRFTGDTIKVGRRGALSGTLKLAGKVGHVAYPHHIINPVHNMGEVIHRLNTIEWEQGSDDFPGTHLQITHIDSGHFTDNVSPAFCKIHFNIRYSHSWCEKTLNEKICEQISSVVNDFELSWQRPCVPYLTSIQTEKSSVLSMLERAVFASTKHYPALSTSGGTSDGRFIASPHCEVYELGVPNSTIHQFNERVSINDLIALRDIYLSLIQQFFK